MAEYYLSFDLHNAKTEVYERLKRLLEREFERVEDGKEEYSFKFSSLVDDLEEIENKLNRLLQGWDITFTVSRLNEEEERKQNGRLEQMRERLGHLSNYGIKR